MSTQSEKLRQAILSDDAVEVEMQLKVIENQPARDAVTVLLLALEYNEDFLDDFYGIMHRAESYPLRDYVAGFLDCIQSGNANAKWSSMLLLRMLNDPAYATELKARMASMSSETRDALRAIADSAAEEKPAYRKDLEYLFV